MSSPEHNTFECCAKRRVQDKIAFALTQKRRDQTIWPMRWPIPLSGPGTRLHLCRFVGKTWQDGGHGIISESPLEHGTSRVEPRPCRPRLYPGAANPQPPGNKARDPQPGAANKRLCRPVFCPNSAEPIRCVMKTRSAPIFVRVAQNLYRYKTGNYYAFVKNAGRRIHRSLDTKDRKLAERRLADFKTRTSDLANGPDANATFGILARHWLDINRHALSVGTAKRKTQYIEAIEPFFNGIALRHIRPVHCERWVLERGGHLSASSFNHELELMKAVFEFARQRGLILDNPAAHIARMKINQPQISVPTRGQLKALVEAIRMSDGRIDSQAKAKAGADLVEILAYSGCRLGEARALLWKHVNFDSNRLIVPGTKSDSSNRVIPMSAPLRDLLEWLQSENPGASLSDHIAKHKSARKCLETACRKLGLPVFYHHAMRHFFATCAIESGVDVPTVSRWLGHKDGGQLAMKVYAHLRPIHSDAMIAQVSFEQAQKMVPMQAA